MKLHSVYKVARTDILQRDIYPDLNYVLSELLREKTLYNYSRNNGRKEIESVSFGQSKQEQDISAKSLKSPILWTQGIWPHGFTLQEQ